MKAVFAANWRLLMFGFLMTFWSGPGQTYLISLYSGEIRESFNLSHGSFGAIYSGATLLSAVAMIWSGRLIDRVDVRTLSTAVVVLLAAGLWWMSFAQGIASLVLGIFLLRHAGQGLMTHTSGTVMVRYFERNKGKTTAFSYVGYVTAEAILPVLTIALIAWVGWRDAFRVSGAVLLMVMIPAVLYLLRNHQQTHRRWLEELEQRIPERDAAAERVHWTRAQMFADPRFYLVLPALMAVPMVFTGFFFHQIHLVQSKGWPLIWWGQMFALYAGTAFAATLVVGPLVDRYRAPRLLPLCLLPFAAGLLLLSVSSGLWTGVAFLVLTGITTGGIAVLPGPFWSEVYGARHLGAIKSVGSAITVFASALSPILMGWLIDRGISLDVQAGASATYLLISAVLARLAFPPGAPVRRAPAQNGD